MQGLVGVASAPGLATLVEVNCETDFVARSSSFTSLLTLVAQNAANLSLQSASGESGVRPLDVATLASSPQPGFSKVRVSASLILL